MVEGVQAGSRAASNAVSATSAPNNSSLIHTAKRVCIIAFTVLVDVIKLTSLLPGAVLLATAFGMDRIQNHMSEKSALRKPLEKATEGTLAVVAITFDWANQALMDASYAKSQIQALVM